MKLTWLLLPYRISDYLVRRTDIRTPAKKDFIRFDYTILIGDSKEDEKENVIGLLGQNSFHSGKIIGTLEKWLILILIMLSQYGAIGFLVAAKSILRFSETNKGTEKSEYVLVGTLFSFLIAPSTGILIVKLQKFHKISIAEVIRIKDYLNRSRIC